jgi:hypothetical protein
LCGCPRACCPERSGAALPMASPPCARAGTRADGTSYGLVASRMAAESSREAVGRRRLRPKPSNLTPLAIARIDDGSTSSRAARRSIPRKMSCARMAGRLPPIWSARALVSQFPTNGRSPSPGESRGSSSSNSSDWPIGAAVRRPVDGCGDRQSRRKDRPGC